MQKFIEVIGHENGNYYLIAPKVLATKMLDNTNRQWLRSDGKTPLFHLVSYAPSVHDDASIPIITQYVRLECLSKHSDSENSIPHFEAFRLIETILSNIVGSQLESHSASCIESPRYQTRTQRSFLISVPIE